LADVVELVERLEDRLDEASPIELRERLAELEFALEDQGWWQLQASGQRELSRGGLSRSIRIAGLMYLANPLIRNAVNVQTNYVWGQGVNITARDPAINEVIQAHLDLRYNRRSWTGHLARLEAEVRQQLAGNQFLALFTRPDTGFVRVRAIDVAEIADILSNPDDDQEPWYYERVWTRGIDPAGAQPTEQQKAYYPDWLHPLRFSGERPEQLRGSPVMWDSPVYHLKTGNPMEHARYGLPEIYAALDWARAVKQDMEDYATIRRALTRFAWNLRRKGGPAAVAAAKARLNTTLGTDNIETNPPPATGSTFIASDGADLQPIRTAGATLAPDEGRRLWLMVAAATGIPETMLSGDATVGNYATAKSLDRPTELEMRLRQSMWAGVISDLLGYVVDQAALAPKGPLTGRLVTDSYTGEQRVSVRIGRQEADRRVDVKFPGILERDVQTRVQAIVGAATLNGQPTAGTLRPETTSRMLLTELLEDQVDEELSAMDAQGMFEDPDLNPAPQDQPPAPVPPPTAPGGGATDTGGAPPQEGS
jgi:hypothetical protein